MKFVPLDKGIVTLVDDEDYPRVSEYRWFAWYDRGGDRYYAITNVLMNGKRTSLRIHRLITGALPEQDVDHKNGNTLDNRRCNLRLCNPSQNGANSKKSKANCSGYKGVSRYKSKWQAHVGSPKYGTYVHAGHFDNPIDAAKAYDEAAIQVYGEFAKTNASLGLLSTVNTK